jgi:hypothetical protein
LDAEEMNSTHYCERAGRSVAQSITRGEGERCRNAPSWLTRIATDAKAREAMSKSMFASVLPDLLNGARNWLHADAAEERLWRLRIRRSG